MNISKTLITAIYFIVFLTSTSISQNWQWDWVKSVGYDNGPNLKYHQTDFFGNYYFTANYSQRIQFPDTVFNHFNLSEFTNNYAIAKFNKEGDFKLAIDLYTTSSRTIGQPRLITDNDMNMYISGSFQEEIFCQDTSIEFTYNGVDWMSDIFIIELNPNNEVAWTAVIDGTRQDNIQGFFMDDDENIYIGSAHDASIPAPTSVIYLQQDTVESYYPFISLIKLDNQKDIIWRKTFECSGFGNFSLGPNNHIYFLGRTWTDIIIEGDTLINPTSSTSFMVEYSQEGELINAQFIHFPGLNRTKIHVLENGELLLNGEVYFNSCIIGQDTINPPQDYKYFVFIKTDSNLTPIWYQVLKSGGGQSIQSPVLTSIVDHHLIFVANTSGNYVDINDSAIYFNHPQNKAIGEFNETGNLVNFKTIASTGGFQYGNFGKDNCSNIIITGEFSRDLITDNDTITGALPPEESFFISKLNTKGPELIDIGNDTAACEAFTINGPSNFQYYLWNDSLSDQNWNTIIETGTYYFACSNEDACWHYDTINIVIHPSFEIELGNDTILKMKDSMVLTVPGEYDSYNWFDGSSLETITIFGKDYEPGIYSIWLRATRESCEATDSISIQIIDASGTNKLPHYFTNVYPNPAHHKVQILLNKNITLTTTSTLLIMNSMGITVEELILNQQNMEVDISYYPAGLYFFVIRNGGVIIETHRVIIE
ncbi:MAG: T9SS type A sorting domain-containing protein [Bacteroidales bacterium]|nr:T9SS type A sorting domain-containing protein [Bacteroidales bacterium]